MPPSGSPSPTLEEQAQGPPLNRIEMVMPDAEAVVERLTKVVWTRNANMDEFPLAWQESLDYIATMNRDNVFGFPDWRLKINVTTDSRHSLPVAENLA